VSSIRRWWTGRAPVSATVATGGKPHHISWKAGRLRLLDHDIAAEEVLLALGGEPTCACLLVRDAFRESALNPLVSADSALSLLPALRTNRQILTLLQHDPKLQRLSREHRERVLDQLRQQVATELVPGPMAELLAEIDRLRRQRHDERERRGEPLRPNLDIVFESAARAAASESVRRARAQMRWPSPVTIECARVPLGTPPRIDGRLHRFGGFVNLALPASWLNRVWLRGIANVDGHLILEVDAPAPAHVVRARAVRWQSTGDGSTPDVASCILARHGHACWRLTWC
jgi:hypothetical protein